MNNDIISLLYKLKENIKLIESEDYSESLLDLVCKDFLELLELIKLFLISERDSYYGYFLMNMQFKANPYCDSIAGIKLNTFPPVFESNPLLLCKFSLKEIIYVVCHEIDHIVLNHPAEMVKANPAEDPDKYYEFNLAADAAVNDRINHEIETENHLFMSQPSGVITSKSLEKMFALRNVWPLENYAYYFSLIEGKKEKSQSLTQNGASSMLGKKQEAENDSNGNGQKSGDSENGTQASQNQVVTAQSCNGNCSDHNWEAGEDAEDITSAVKELVNASFNMMNEETRDMMPGYFLSQVEKINKPPKLAWQAILKKYIGTISANKKHTRTRLNRRQPERFDLSGKVDDKVLKIAVAIDTSASMSDEIIAEIFNEIFSILAKRKHEITVIECDYKVQRVYKAKNQGDIKMKITGRGGTCFSPVIEFVNKDKYFRDALLIYFTDGYGENEIPKPLTYRNIWVVIGDERHLSIQEPYGAVLSLKV